MKWPLRHKETIIPPWGHKGDFAFKRSFYYHPGIDLYCPDLTIVQAVEDGEVVNIEVFTGPNADPPSPWWMTTHAVLIEGASGALGYCEIDVFKHIKIGTIVAEGEAIGLVTPVLKKDKGNGTTMLHFEKYTKGTSHHETWVLDTPKPSCLRNPRKLLQKIINENL